MTPWTSTGLDTAFRNKIAFLENSYPTSHCVKDLGSPDQPSPHSSESSTTMSRAGIHLTLLANGHPDQEIYFDGERAAIGSGPEADIRLTGSRVSPLHAIITRSGGAFWLQDAGSAWGTFVNGWRVQAVALQEGDRVGVGVGGG